MPSQAQRPDELSIKIDEELEVLEWDDGDGWSKGRNQSGLEGYFPQTYVRAVSPSSSPRSSSIQQVQLMINSHLTGPLQDLGSEVSRTYMIEEGPWTKSPKDPAVARHYIHKAF